MPKLDKTALLIDGDILAYRAAAATEKRTVQVSDMRGEYHGEHNTRTAFKESVIKERGVYNKEDYVFTDIQTPEPPENALHILSSQIANFHDLFWPDEVRIFISGKNNFRDALELPTKYKGHRTDMLRPIHLKECKSYLWKRHGAVVSDNAEADDYLTWNAYEYLKRGYSPIIATIDKDAMAYTGTSVWDFSKEGSKPKLIPDLGSLWETKSGIRGDGFIWLCFQWLNGDSSDCYFGSELAGVRFGEKSAYKLLKDAPTKRDAVQIVVDKYKEWYPEPFQYTAWNGDTINSDYKHMLQLYLKCCKMKTTRDDPIDLGKFLDKQGVALC